MSKSRIGYICFLVFLIPSWSFSLGHDTQPQDEYVFEIHGDEVPVNFAERVMRPVLAQIEMDRARILDVEQDALITEPKDRKRSFRKAMMRSVVEPDGNKEYFVAVDKSPDLRTSEEVASDLERISLEAELKLQSMPTEMGRIITKLSSFDRATPPPGGAFCYDGRDFTLFLFDSGVRGVVTEKYARRLAGYVPYRAGALITAADVVLGPMASSGVTVANVAKIYSTRPNAAKFYANGSTLVTWELLDGRVSRQIYFNSDCGGLPVRLTDRLRDETGPPFAETIAEWRKVEGDRFELGGLQATYRTPGPSGKAGYVVDVTAEFTWTEGAVPGCFDPDRTGLHMPFSDERSTNGRR
jgi:hypothetical protein